VHRLIADPPAVIIEQRPTYDLLTTSIVRWLRGTTVIFDIDDWIGDYTWFYPLRVEAVLPRFRSIASACIVSSTRLERELAPIFPVTVKIPTYVDTKVFRPREVERSSPEVVFGWNGTLFQEFMFESLSVMLKAFSLACDRLGGSTAIAMEIAGTGDYFPKLEELLAKDYSEYPIRIKGWLDPRTMSEYLDTIDVGLYSLVVTDARRGTAEETFIVSKSPTKVFEYMAKGIPTISTRVGEVGSVIEQGVTGICSDDIASLCDGFVTLATDPELRKRMGVASRTLCEQRYSMTTAAQQLLDVIAACDKVSARDRGLTLREGGVDTAEGEKGAC
jgi:glycosyltransferase involved in cell wall biosynthesis